MSHPAKPAADLYQLAHQVLVAVDQVSTAIGESIENEGAACGGPRPEPIDPWLLYVLCDEFGAALEQLSFPL